MRVVYRLRVEEALAAQRAEAVALEQTVEVPRAAVRDPFVEKEILGRVESVVPDSERTYLATIALPVAATGLDPAHLLTILFGNTSLQPDAELVSFELPDELLRALRGPRFGIEGIRRQTGVEDRALTCTALKPQGLSVDALAHLCTRFARAGIDLIKDDHGLADQSFAPFADRLEACQRAVEEVADETGHRALYVPNLTGTPEVIARQLDRAQEAGVGAVMVAPMLVGLPAFWELCQQRCSVPVLAHPTWGGALRIAPETLFGRIYRLYGADAVIFVHWDGRFAYSPDTCSRLAEGLREPWGEIRPALPVPAGGLSVDRVQRVVEFYGRDQMLLIGGSLYLAGSALEARSRGFAESVARASEALG
ncbi:MAG: RuBisCO large subunit C-terminal-like domain-containing protein [Proteobacteria bacterium]|nr:RuBisCO large subunit C-terminal-like domain-containing protein [Pseudomonadota bacterium]